MFCCVHECPRNVHNERADHTGFSLALVARVTASFFLHAYYLNTERIHNEARMRLGSRGSSSAEYRSRANQRIHPIYLTRARSEAALRVHAENQESRAPQEWPYTRLYVEHTNSSADACVWLRVHIITKAVCHAPTMRQPAFKQRGAYFTYMNVFSKRAKEKNLIISMSGGGWLFVVMMKVLRCCLASCIFARVF